MGMKEEMEEKTGKRKCDGPGVIGERIKKDIKQYGTGLLAAVALYFFVHAVSKAFCPSVLVTGFPCPGCGMTRAVLYLLKGQFARSWALNPAGIFWVIWALWFAFERYVRGRRPKILGWAACGIVLFMVTAYLVRMNLYFPDRPPYVYTRDNLFARLLPGYEKVVRYLTGR